MAIEDKVRTKIDKSVYRLAQELATEDPERWKAEAERFVHEWQTGPFSGFFYGQRKPTEDQTAPIRQAYFPHNGQTKRAYFPRQYALYDPGPIPTDEQRAKAERLEIAREYLCEVLAMLPPFADLPLAPGELRQRRVRLLRLCVDYLDRVQEKAPQRAKNVIAKLDNPDTRKIVLRPEEAGLKAFLEEMASRPRGAEKRGICKRHAKLLNKTPAALEKRAWRILGPG